jgi:diketogulonate reductase-like aldo/keto reductase
VSAAALARLPLALIPPLDGLVAALTRPEVEYHPYVLSHLEPVKKIQDQHGIRFQAYGPLTPLLRHPTGGPIKPILERVAKRLSAETGKPVDAHAALALWFLTQNIPIVTASGSIERIPALAAVEQLPDLTPEEVEEITEVGKKVHFRHYRVGRNVDLC